MSFFEPDLQCRPTSSILASNSQFSRLCALFFRFDASFWWYLISDGGTKSIDDHWKSRKWEELEETDICPNQSTCILNIIWKQLSTVTFLYTLIIWGVTLLLGCYSLPECQNFQNQTLKTLLWVLRLNFTPLDDIRTPRRKGDAVRMNLSCAVSIPLRPSSAPFASTPDAPECRRCRRKPPKNDNVSVLMALATFSIHEPRLRSGGPHLTFAGLP